MIVWKKFVICLEVYGCGEEGPAAIGCRYFQFGFGKTIFVLVAANFGATTCDLPFCHCASRNAWRGAPVASQLSGPRIVCTLFECSQSLIASWSIFPTFFTAVASTCAAANASAASSAGIEFLPYFAWYAWRNSWFCGYRVP